MRWGNGEFEFIRPIRSFLCLLGDEVIKFNKFGVESSNSTYPHRSISYDNIKISNIKEYFDGSKSRGVVLEADEREKIILDEFEKISQKSGLKIEIDKELLAEVVAITEYPTALLGSFEEEFLEVPSEVIITSMKENQRYFPVFKDGKLANGFVVVSNAITQDYSLIIKGNEKVLRARLSDAMFFWQSDLKAEFSPEKLKNITYLKELGSIYEKELRELKVAKKLASNYGELLKKEAGEYWAKLERAVMLSKADLTTQMVYEFTELQGIMGAYYAKAKNEDEKQRIVRIYNPLDTDEILRKSKAPLTGDYRHPLFLSVGTVFPQKGFDRLLKAHKRLLNEGFSHQILIVGDGYDFENIKKSINSICYFNYDFNINGKL